MCLPIGWNSQYHSNRSLAKISPLRGGIQVHTIFLRNSYTTLKYTLYMNKKNTLISLKILTVMRSLSTPVSPFGNGTDLPVKPHQIPF